MRHLAPSPSVLTHSLCPPAPPHPLCGVVPRLLGGASSLLLTAYTRQQAGYVSVMVRS